MPSSLSSALVGIFVASLSGVVGYSPPLLHPNFSQCKLEILNNSTLDSNPAFRPFFVDIDGRPAKGQYDIKGVDYTTCISYCGTTSELPKWSFFAPQFTAWLLPFIALTAQFPYQASTTWDNFMSAFLTVGSPALAVYSLVLTFLNARWLHRRCHEITESMVVSTAEERGRKSRVKSIFKSMKRVVSLAQQEPYEDVNFDIPETNNIDKALEDDDEWWKKLVAATEKTKRGYTASFVHQLLWVNIAFAFTIVDAFGSEKIGNNATAFGLAIALVWQWETPVVMGWVLAGTQAVDSGVRDAIREIKELNINQEPRATRFFEPYSLGRRRGLINGDRGRPGPIFNYARVSIWTYRAEEIVDFYRQSFESEVLDRMPYIPTDGYWRIVARDHALYAVASALLLQWSTAGASVFLNWLTPTIGLSCRSGGILIYATCSTVVLIFLMLASFLSDFWTQESLHRAEVRRAPWYKPISLLGYFAVFLRTIGKTIAIANSLWICIHCLFEFTSFYENCWCKANYVSKGDSGFWTWVSDAELREYNNVSQVWGGATAMAVLISGLFVAFFLVAHHHYRL